MPNVLFSTLNKNLGWHLCITCKRDMGPDNPRQLCGKYQCDYEDEMEADLEDIPTIEEQIIKEMTNEELANEFWESQKKSCQQCCSKYLRCR
jgi:hypothetical protein